MTLSLCLFSLHSDFLQIKIDPNTIAEKISACPLKNLIIFLNVFYVVLSIKYSPIFLEMGGKACTESSCGTDFV